MILFRRLSGCQGISLAPGCRGPGLPRARSLGAAAEPHRRLWIPAVVIVLLLAAPQARPQGLHVRVNRAVDRGAQHLAELQKEDGSFGSPDPEHPVGRTALALLALLHAGLREDHPAVRKGLGSLGLSEGYASRISHRSTYETGILLLLMHALGGHERAMHKLASWLVKNVDTGSGLWGYPWGDPDLSNTQYAVLGLHVATQHGFRVPRKLWLELVDGVLSHQDEEGGFRYRPDSLATGSMTHSGLLCLLFAEKALGRAAPRGRIRRAMERGHRWYKERFSVRRNPMGYGHAPYPGYYYYYMYGLERYGVFFDRRTIAGHDWYREGARRLLELQGDDGSWGTVVDCSFAILFLRKAGFTISAPREQEDAGEAAPEAEEKAPAPPGPAAGVPFIRTWLLLGPFQTEPGMDYMLVKKHIHESRVTPASGSRMAGHTWKAYTSPADKVDLQAATRGAGFAAWYAYIWLVSEREQEVVLWIGSDDGCRVLLNGRRVLDGHHHDGVPPDHYRVPLDLEKGTNGLLVKVENVGYHAWFQARITGPRGRAPVGLRTTIRRPRGR